MSSTNTPISTGVGVSDPTLAYGLMGVVDWSTQMARAGSLYHQDLGAVINRSDYADVWTLGENILVGPAGMPRGKRSNQRCDSTRAATIRSMLPWPAPHTKTAPAGASCGRSSAAARIGRSLLAQFPLARGSGFGTCAADVGPGRRPPVSSCWQGRVCSGPSTRA